MITSTSSIISYSVLHLKLKVNINWNLRRYFHTFMLPPLNNFLWFCIIYLLLNIQNIWVSWKFSLHITRTEKKQQQNVQPFASQRWFREHMKQRLLNCFWMGFLLFLPAYMQSPGGIMILRSVEVTGALRRKHRDVNFTCDWRENTCVRPWALKQVQTCTLKVILWVKCAVNPCIPTITLK